jgi:hypothetical protein
LGYYLEDENEKTFIEMESPRKQLLKSNYHDYEPREIHADKVRREKSKPYRELIVIIPHSQGRDNMIHIWELSIQEQAQHRCVSSIVYNALGFCKFSCHSQGKFRSINDEVGLIFFYLHIELLCFPSKNDIAFVRV